jgi:hypothetical protein
MSTIYTRSTEDLLELTGIIQHEFSLNFQEAFEKLEQIIEQYDFTDITGKELLNYAWDNMEKLKC